MDALNYKGLTAQQHAHILQVFPPFLGSVRPSRILEIGTAEGGFTLFLKDCLDSCGLSSSQLRSYDVREHASYGRLRDRGIDVRVEDVFASPSGHGGGMASVKSYIGSPGLTIVLCDGGDKVGEFNELAQYLKPGDFIMAHDYVESRAVFEHTFRGKIWDWCEVEDQSLEEACRKHDLNPYRKDLFDGVVWACRQKILPGTSMR